MITKRKNTVVRLIYPPPNNIASATKFFELNYMEGTTFRICSNERKINMNGHYDEEYCNVAKIQRTTYNRARWVGL